MVGTLLTVLPLRGLCARARGPRVADGLEASRVMAAGARGSFELRASWQPGRNSRLRAVMTSLDGRAGLLPDVSGAFPAQVRMSGRFIALPEPPLVRSPDDLLAFGVREALINARQPKVHRHRDLPTHSVGHLGRIFRAP